jgi:mRNA deadenylase 3'-5' endonuclease subunit Ccr4
MGWYSDGCVLAWKSSTFDLVHAKYSDYAVGNQVYIIATLQHRLTKQSVIVAVTHLKAQQKEMNEVVRNRQVNELLACIDNEAMRFTNFFPDMQLQVVVLGDFNADPPSLMNSDRSAIQKLLTHKIHGIDECYHSAYKIDDSLDNSFTTWKIRAHNECKRIIDYIFYAGSSLRCLATYKAVSPSDIEDSKLPGLRHPSDHMHIAAKFDFLKT